MVVTDKLQYTVAMNHTVGRTGDSFAICYSTFGSKNLKSTTFVSSLNQYALSGSRRPSRAAPPAGLGQRRLRLCCTFARRTAKNSRHQDLFTRLENPRRTRGGLKEWREPPCRTRRHLRSARPHLTRILNGELK
jgi:hypothetical protein